MDRTHVLARRRWTALLMLFSAAGLAGATSAPIRAAQKTTPDPPAARTSAPTGAPAAQTPPSSASPATPANNDKKTRVLFKGIVQDGKLQPLSGATVTVASLERNVPGEQPSIRGRTTAMRAFGLDLADEDDYDRSETRFFSAKTDASGAFSIEAKAGGSFSLLVEAAGFAPTTVENVKPGEGVSTVYLKPGFTAKGIVADRASGLPVEGAEVAAIRELDRGFGDPDDPKRFATTVRTGKDGTFSIPNLDANFYTFRVTAAARASFEASGKPIGDGIATASLAFYLRPGFDVSGRIVGPEGKPLTGQKISVVPLRGGATILSGLRGGYSAPVTRTDKDGRYTLRGIPTEGRYGINVEPKEFAPVVNLEVPSPTAGASLSNLEIRLERGVPLKAKLVDADQKPVASEVTIGLSYSDPKTQKHLYGFTRSGKELHQAADGQIALDRLPVGTATISITAVGYKGAIRKAVAVGRSTGPTDLGTIALDRGKRIAGRVLDADGHPVSGAKAKASGMSAARSWQSADATSDPSGRFALTGIDEGKYTLQVQASGFATATKRDVGTDGEPIDITLARAGSLAGRVVAGDPPAPVAAFSIEANPKSVEGMQDRGFMNFGGGGVNKRLSDPRGRIALGNLAPGTYSLSVKADGFQEVLREGIEIRGGETTDLGDLPLSAGGTVRGRVQSQPEGLPIAGAAVRVKKAGLFNMNARDLLGADATLTDLAGRFELRGLPTGTATLVVEPPNYAKTELAGVTVSEGAGGEEVVVNVGKGGRIEGRVIAADGSPRRGVTVTAMAGLADVSGTQTAATDDQGRYSIENISPGSVRVMVFPDFSADEDSDQPRLGGMESQTADVKDGETAVVNFGEVKIKVHGTVRKKGATMPKAQVFFFGGGSGGTGMGMQTATADDTGHYEISLNQPGDYVVNVGEAGRAPGRGQTLNTTVPDKPDVSYDIVVPEGAISGRIVDQETGQPLSSVMVIAQPTPKPGEKPSARGLRGGSTAMTGEDGTYRLEGLTTGSWDLSFSREGYGTETRPAFEIKGTEEASGIDAVLGKGTPFKVRVSGGTGSGIQGAIVFVTQGGTPLAGVGGLTDETGTIELKQLKPGVYSFFALARDLAPGTANETPVGGPNDPPQTSIALTAGAAVRIVVRDGKKDPVAGATIALEDTTEPGFDTMLRLSSMMRGGSPATGPDGTSRIEHLPPGKYDVTITKGETKLVKAVTLEEGATAELAVTFE